MKLIHCADLHLDSKMETTLSTVQAKERRYEILATFEDMVAYARQQNVEVIMIAGDLFDTSQNQQKTIKNRVLDTIVQASEITFLYLQGNHDKDNFFQTLEQLPSNFKLFSHEWTTYTFGNVAITGIVFTKENQDTYLDTLTLEENSINLVLLHGQVTEYQVTGAEVIPLSCLREKYIDYLALGHIHEYAQGPLDDRGIYCYSGCLEGRGFDECGEKGFVVLDLDEEKIHTEFVSLARRTFHEIRVDATPYSNFAELMEEITNTIDPICADDLIKVRIVGEIEEGFELDLTYLEEFVKRRFYYAKVKNESELRIDGDKYKNDPTLKGEFIRKVQLLSVSEEEKNRIIQLGLKAIAGKEVTL